MWVWFQKFLCTCEVWNPYVKFLAMPLHSPSPVPTNHHLWALLRSQHPKPPKWPRNDKWRQVIHLPPRRQPRWPSLKPPHYIEIQKWLLVPQRRLPSWPARNGLKNCWLEKCTLAPPPWRMSRNCRTYSVWCNIVMSIWCILDHMLIYLYMIW